MEIGIVFLVVFLLAGINEILNPTLKR